MVAVGLVFELPELRYELKLIVRDLIPYFRYRIFTPSERRVHLAKVIAFIGWILIVVGVAGERVAEVKVKDFDVRIQECSDSKVTEATLEAGDAKSSAASAKASADAAGIEAGKAEASAKSALDKSKAANDVAGKAQQKAVGAAEQAGMAKADAAKAQESATIAGNMAMRERFEREQMERLSLPRKLNGFRWFEYRKQLEKYAGTKFFIVTLTDTEPMRLGKKIEDLLKASKWEKEEPMIRYSEADELMIPDGIWIEANGPVVTVPPKPLTVAMDALRDVLVDSNISANRSALNPHLPPDKLPPNTLRVVIGLKPDLYFEMKRLQNESEEQHRRNPPPPPKPK
jgi:hypothetical protein